MDMMTFVGRAKTSGFYLWLLNNVFDRIVPFNKPHHFRILEIGDDYVKTTLPYRTRNLNHVKGLHACALATLTELTSGFLLASRLDPKKFRLILKRLEIDYLYQGKMDAICEFRLSDDKLRSAVTGPLDTLESTVFVAEVNIMDIKGNQLTAGRAHWQIKDWRKVKTKA
jgi:acyl-coenzyme A thioesterase PaaI-like protein